MVGCVCRYVCLCVSVCEWSWAREATVAKILNWVLQGSPEAEAAYTAIFALSPFFHRACFKQSILNWVSIFVCEWGFTLGGCSHIAMFLRVRVCGADLVVSFADGL